MLLLAMLHQMQKPKAKKKKNEWIGEHDFTFFMHFQQHYQTQTKHAFTSLKNRVEVAVSLYLFYDGKKLCFATQLWAAKLSVRNFVCATAEPAKKLHFSTTYEAIHKRRQITQIKKSHNMIIF